MLLSNRTLLWLNTLTFALMLLVNSAGSVGWLGGAPTVAEVSAQYPNLLTPAGYAFSIWGIIYIVLAIYLAFQWQGYLRNDNSQSLEPSGLWFTASNIFNTLWIIAWVNNEIGLSVLLILGLFISLSMLVVNLRMELDDVPVHIIFFVWWPICIYIGWITLALPVNIVVLLTTAFVSPPVLSGSTWGVIALAMITTVYLLWTYKRNMREASLVGIWGFIAVAVNQWDASRLVSTYALIAAALLLVTVTHHYYRNRETSPYNKIKRSEF